MSVTHLDQDEVLTQFLYKQFAEDEKASCPKHLVYHISAAYDPQRRLMQFGN
jgi:hypothetical protein